MICLVYSALTWWANGCSHSNPSLRLDYYFEPLPYPEDGTTNDSDGDNVNENNAGGLVEQDEEQGGEGGAPADDDPGAGAATAAIAAAPTNTGAVSEQKVADEGGPAAEQKVADAEQQDLSDGEEGQDQAPPSTAPIVNAEAQGQYEFDLDFSDEAAAAAAAASGALAVLGKQLNLFRIWLWNTFVSSKRSESSPELQENAALKGTPFACAHLRAPPRMCGVGRVLLGQVYRVSLLTFHYRDA